VGREGLSFCVLAVYCLKKNFIAVRHYNISMKLCSVWVARRPPGYAFVEFDDRRDALDAVQSLDGQYEASVISFYLITLVCIEVDRQKYSILLLN
jgi:hypothetical protein